MSYDLIGDVHGEFDQLVALLRRLGYREERGAWRHPERTVIFVGDLIDRGPNQVETVQLVRRMVEAGSAECLLGNHEFNAVCWATPDPTKSGAWLRCHDRPGNRAQHQAFLAEVEGKPVHQELIAWFKTLPLWLDKDGLRVVHACWHEPSMAVLADRLGPNQTLTDELFVQAGLYQTPEFVAVEALCKGLDVALPEGFFVEDADGNRWPRARVRWWLAAERSMRDLVMVSDELGSQLPDQPLDDARLSNYQGPPLFFGHYWFQGNPAPLTPAIACLDYGAAKGGPLVSYRWEGEPFLLEGNFVLSRL